MASYADGTKLCMETAVVANAAGFGVAQRGMRGSNANTYATSSSSATRTSSCPRIGRLRPGRRARVGRFRRGYNETADLQPYFKYFKLGDGPFYVFYTPWHLPHAEAPLTAARAELFHDASVTPIGAPECDVVTIAKRDLRAGEVLDGFGGYTCYGTIDDFEVGRREGLLPMGLSEGCELLVDVAAHEPVRYEDVRAPAGRLIDSLRREQDALFGPS